MKTRKRSLFPALALVLCLGLLAVPAEAHDMCKPGAYQAVSAGRGYTMAIQADGSLWAWGDGIYGQLGDNGSSMREDPIKVLDNVSAVSAWSNHTLALKTDGSLWACGLNRGQFGSGKFGTNRVFVKVMDGVAAASAGFGHSLILKTDGSLWACGGNRYGELGLGVAGQDSQTTPVKVMDGVTAAVAGDHCSLAIRDDGSLWAWGINNYGVLGNGSTDLDPHPTPVKVMDNVSAVSAGSLHTVALKTDGTLWAWGSNSYGQLGLGAAGVEYSTPAKVMDNVSAVSAGGDHTLALKTDGTLWSWGRNWYGQLGQGTVDQNQHPTPVQMMDNVAAMSAGENHSLIVKGDGTLWACGWNGAIGKWGDDDKDIEKGTHTPVKVMDNILLPTAAAPTPIAYAATQSVLVDGKAVEFQCYALKDAKGNPTNYVKVRDVAYVLNGSKAQFNVGWSGAVDLTTGQAYTPNGSEMKTPFSGDRAYTVPAAETKANGQAVKLEAIYLTDDKGGGYTYYKLRDLGRTLGFNVGWSADKGVYVETDKPYDPNN